MKYAPKYFHTPLELKATLYLMDNLINDRIEAPSSLTAKSTMVDRVYRVYHVVASSSLPLNKYTISQRTPGMSHGSLNAILGALVYSGKILFTMKGNRSIYALPTETTP